MSIVAAPGASRIVQQFVLALNTVLGSTPQKPAERAGESRAKARLKAQAKTMSDWHKSATKARAKLEPSRQVRRAMARKGAKSKLAVQKKQVMLDKRLGGAAAV